MVASLHPFFIRHIFLPKHKSIQSAHFIYFHSTFSPLFILLLALDSSLGLFNSPIFPSLAKATIPSFSLFLFYRLFCQKGTSIRRQHFLPFLLAKNAAIIEGKKMAKSLHFPPAVGTNGCQHSHNGQTNRLFCGHPTSFHSSYDQFCPSLFIIIPP